MGLGFMLEFVMKTKVLNLREISLNKSYIGLIVFGSKELTYMSSKSYINIVLLGKFLVVAKNQN